EDHAAMWPEQRGLRILERNLPCRSCAIDLVARDAAVLVFVEVRLRRSARHGGAAASVNRRKPLTPLRAARNSPPHLRHRHVAGRTPPCRFDVSCMQNGVLHWTPHACTE